MIQLTSGSVPSEADRRYVWTDVRLSWIPPRSPSQKLVNPATGMNTDLDSSARLRSPGHGGSQHVSEPM